MTSGQCDANASHGFLLPVCMGIVAIAGMPEARINMNFVLFLACFLYCFSQRQYYNIFLPSLSPGKALNF
jgi:hypothetical protein